MAITNLAARIESPQRTQIELRGGELHLYVDAAHQLLAADVFVRGRELVRIGAAPELVSAMHRGLQRRNDQSICGCNSRRARISNVTTSDRKSS